MSRPIYESPDDRGCEEVFRQFLNFLLPEPRTVVGTPTVTTFDFVVIDANTKAVHSLHEFKRRHHNYGDFSTLHISAEKLLNIRATAEVMHVPGYLHIGWNDQTKYFDLKNLSSCGYVWNGRVDRNDGKDMEIMADIPIEMFNDYGKSVKSLSWN
jgi:hypothetical protein